MLRASLRSAAAAFILVLVATAGAAAAGPAGAPHLDAHRFPAAGRHQARLVVPYTGRYRISAKGGTGVALTLVDRMRGDVAHDGTPGKADGTIDALLDAGAYLVRLQGAGGATGEVVLSAARFHDADGGPVPVLVPGRERDTTLGDGERRAFWIEVPRRQPVLVEAAGRHLEALDLWAEGRYRVKVQRRVDDGAGQTGRPQRDVRLAATLDPGHYLVTAWGGTGQPWAAGGDGAPLEVRLGVPPLAPVSVTRGRVSAMGLDRYRVATGRRSRDIARLVLARPADARVTVAEAPRDQLPRSGGATGVLTHKQRHPEVDVYAGSGAGDREVVVRAAPGTAYTLYFLRDADHLDLRVTRGGDYFISTLETAAPDHGLQATGLVADHASGAWSLVAASAPHLGRDARFGQSLNLRGRTAALLVVDDPGDYRIDGDGVGFRFTLVRLQVDRRRYRRPPAPQRPGVVRNLAAGVYRLTLFPVRAGVAEVRLGPAGDRSSSPGEPPRLRASVQLPRVHLAPERAVFARRHDYRLQLGLRPGDHRGLVFRRLPLDLTRALPVDLAPGVPVPLDVAVKARARLQVAGVKVAVTVDGRGCPGTCTLAPGRHAVVLTAAGAAEQVTMVRLVPEAERQAMGRTLPQPPPDPALTVPELTPGGARFFDLARGASRTFRLEVPRPAVYRVETTGLLATSVTLRTRARLELATDVAGGDGRNGRVVRFLRAGEYLVRVAAQGRSAGHAGIEVTRAPVLDGGVLPVGRRGRAAVPAGAGLVYTIPIQAAGRYQLTTLAHAQQPRARLTDADGWPVAPVDHGPVLGARLEPGRYRWLTEGLAVPGRRVTRVTPVREQRVVQGRGPHALRLNEQVTATWHQGDGHPDVYTFHLPARVKALVSLASDRMQGHLFRAGDPTHTPVAVLAPGKTFAGDLDAGDYRLEAVCSRLDNGVPYQVRVAVDDLVAGTARPVTVPQTVDVVVGRAELVVLTSTGDVDVRGTLRDAAGKVVARGDDRPDDWNFRLARRLAPGRYRLTVEAVGQDVGPVRVHYQVPGEAVHRAVPVPGRTDVDLGGGMVTVPLAAGGAGLLRVRLRSDAAVAATLSGPAPGPATGAVAGAAAARGVGTQVVLARPVAPGEKLRLRLLAGTSAPPPVDLRVDRLAPPTWRLEGGELHRRVRGGVVRLQVIRPGTFAVSPAQGLRAGTGEAPLSPVDASDLSLPVGSAWLLWSRAPGRVRLRRVVLARGRLGTRLAPGARRHLDLAPTQGLLLARVEGDGGRPAARFDGAGAGSFDLGPRATLAAAPPGARRALTLWNADPGAEAPLSVTVTRFAFPLKRSRSAGPGTTTVVVPKGGARPFTLPGGPVALHLGLARGLAAVAWDAGGVRAVVDATGAPADRHLVVDATHLAVVDLAGHGGQAVVTLRVAAAGTRPGPAPGRPYVRAFDAPGRTELEVPAGPWTVRVSGLATASVMDPRGLVHAGRRLALPAGGPLALRHGAGDVAVWLEGAAHPNLDRWGRLPTVPAAPSAPDAVVPLGGSVQWLAVHLGTPTVLSATAPAGTLVAISRPLAAGPGASVERRLGALAGDPLAEVAEGHLSRLVPAGDYLVGLRAAGGGGLQGVVRLGAEPAVELVGGVGPTTLLAGGETRSFTFTVKRGRRIGVGVRADADTVDAALLGPDGARLADGRQALVRLEPGRYQLRVRCPAGRGPVQVAPVVLGLLPPSEGPPPEALAKLLQSAGLTPATPAQEGR